MVPPNRPHPLYRQFNWDQIRRKRRAGECEEGETVVLPRPGDDLFPLCPRARTNSRSGDARQRGVLLPCLRSLRFVLARLFLRSPSCAWDSRIDRGIRKATLISSDRSRLEAVSEKNEGADRRMYVWDGIESLVRNTSGGASRGSLAGFRLRLPYDFYCRYSD